MRRSHSLHSNQLPPFFTKFVQLVFDRLSIELAGQKFSLNSKGNNLVFPFIHICLKNYFFLTRAAATGRLLSAAIQAQSTAKFSSGSNPRMNSSKVSANTVTL